MKSQNVNSKYAAIKITRREREILECLVEDMRTEEIAGKLKLTKNTVNTYRKNLLSKFDKRTSAGLVKAAMVWGFIK